MATEELKGSKVANRGYCASGARTNPMSQESSSRVNEQYTPLLRIQTNCPWDYHRNSHLASPPSVHLPPLTVFLAFPFLFFFALPGTAPPTTGVDAPLSDCDGVVAPDVDATGVLTSVAGAKAGAGDSRAGVVAREGGAEGSVARGVMVRTGERVGGGEGGDGV